MKKYIYEIKNLINGKTYVGQRKCHEEVIEKDYYMGSGTAITAAIDKYGKENFEKVILEEIPEDADQDYLNEREIYWIRKRKSEGKAEYNIAGGGQACSYPLEYKTEEEKREIYRKSAESRRGLPSKSLHKTWKKSVVEPPHSNAKEALGMRVIIMETEERFLSYEDCADYLGVDNSCVRKCCIGDQKTTGGYHVCFEKDYSKENNPWLGKPRGKLNPRAGKSQPLSKEAIEHSRAFNATLSKPVKCTTNGKTYPSINEAARDLNLSVSSIVASLNGRQESTGGYLFERVEIERKDEPFLIILENEMTFKTISECATYIGCNRSTIFGNLAGKNKQCKGYHVAYFSGYSRENNPWFGKERYSSQPPRGMKRRVQCIETGTVFDSIGEAGDSMGLSPSRISSVCSGDRKSTGGYSFRYIDEF